MADWTEGTVDERRRRAYEDFRGWLGWLAKGRSLRQIAQRSGLDHSTIARLLGGDREPALATMTALVEAFIREEPKADESGALPRPVCGVVATCGRWAGHRGQHGGFRPGRRRIAAWRCSPRRSSTVIRRPLPLASVWQGLGPGCSCETRGGSRRLTGFTLDSPVSRRLLPKVAVCVQKWRARRDSNPRPSGPQPDG